MKIERIDDKTVKCFLSNKELEEYQITYKDFILRSDKAREVVEEIIEQAEEEVGYQPPQFAFDLQIMMLPDKGMILTFSEKEPDEVKAGESLLECLKEMKDMLTDQTGGEDTQQNSTELSAGGLSMDAKKAADNTTQEQAPDYAMFRFPELQSLLQYAAVLPANLRVKSTLYRMEEGYFLYLNKGGASYKRYSRACIEALEFGELYAAGLQRVNYVEEHAECLIADHAVKKLRLGTGAAAARK